MIRAITLTLALAGTIGPGRADPLQAQARDQAQDRGQAHESGQAGDREAPEAPESTLAALLAAAERDNPRIEAARQNAAAAEARVPQAGALPDPVLGVALMNIPVDDPSLGGDMMTMTTVQLGGRFPFPGTLGLREEVARFEADAAVWEVERVRLDVLVRVESAYYRVYFIDRALEVTARNEVLLNDFADLASTNYGVGAGTQADVLKAQVERTRLEDQLVALSERRRSEVARLNALLARSTETPLPDPGIPEAVRVAALRPHGWGGTFSASALDGVLDEPAGEPVRSVAGIPTVEELQDLSLRHNPEIQAHRRRIDAGEGAVSLAERAVLPDVNVSLGYSRRPSLGDFWSLSASVPLPVFRGRKQDQGVVEEGADLAGRRATLQETIDRVHGEIASRSADLRRARDQLVLLEDGILPQAGTSLASATASYRVGRVEFLTLLDAQVTLYRHELDYHRLLADFADNLAALERAVGTEVLR